MSTASQFRTRSNKGRLQHGVSYLCPEWSKFDIFEFYSNSILKYNLFRCSFSSPDRCHQSYSPSSTGITKHFSFMRKQRTRNLAFSGFSGHVVENNHAKEETDPFDDELDSKIERECVRVRLLQLLDLQFVEGFVCSPSAGQTQGITKASRPLVDVLRFHSLFNSRKSSKRIQYWNLMCSSLKQLLNWETA